ncbi:hypothetical protein BGZ73_006188 [Actinomortierella ambigua]|nr:hypothetical protein BGZ73_006188 [Actinomortierella ambigua]
MGCDGGSIPKRDELVKQKQKQVRMDPNMLSKEQWTMCALSKRPLAMPIAACGLGRLYNRDAIIEFLLDRSVYGDGDVICSHIKSLKDIVALRLEPNPAVSEKHSSSPTHVHQELPSQFICPVTRKEMNGKQRFVFIDTCGCVLSEQAMKEIPSKTCVQCGKAFEQDNVIVINPKPEEQEVMKANLAVKQAKKEAEKEKKKKEKAAKKEAKREANGGSLKESSSSNNKRKLDTASEQDHHKKAKTNATAPPMAPTSATHALTAAVAAKVAEQMAINANRHKSSAIQSLYSTKTKA